MRPQLKEHLPDPKRFEVWEPKGVLPKRLVLLGLGWFGLVPEAWLGLLEGLALLPVPPLPKGTKNDCAAQTHKLDKLAND